VPARPAHRSLPVDIVIPGRRGGEHDPVGADPPHQVNRQVGQDEGEAAHVVAGVEHHHDRRVTGPPVPGRAQPAHDRAQLGGGDRGGVVGRAEADYIQRRGPTGRAGLERDHQLIRPPRDLLIGGPAAAVDMAEEPLGAGFGVRAQPSRGIDRQHDATAEHHRHRQRRQPLAQPVRVDRSAVQRVVQSAVAAAMLRNQAQPDQGPHRPLRAQQRVGQLKQLVGSSTQAPVELTAELAQPPVGRLRGRALVNRPGPVQTVHHGHRRSP
jgi:hypothetical protein